MKSEEDMLLVSWVEICTFDFRTDDWAYYKSLYLFVLTIYYGSKMMLYNALFYENDNERETGSYGMSNVKQMETVRGWLTDSVIAGPSSLSQHLNTKQVADPSAKDKDGL